jgi:Protein of unknown function (DUF3500)
MNERFWPALVACAVVTFGAHGQSDDGDPLLRVRRLFADDEIAALKEPYVGIATSKGIDSSLFPIRSTGVSTEPIRFAAEKFLATLTPAQTPKTLLDVEDPEWRKWSNVDNGIYVRQGVSMEEVTALQREAAFGLMRTSLSVTSAASIVLEQMRVGRAHGQRLSPVTQLHLERPAERAVNRLYRAHVDDEAPVDLPEILRIQLLPHAL